MDKKNKVIVFGAGNFFWTRKNMLEKENEIICILDNNAKDNSYIYNIPIYKPEKIANLPDVQIIIMTEFFIEIILQLGELMGEEACNRRVKIGSLCFPKSHEEEILNKATARILLRNNKVFVIVEDNIEIELKNNSEGIKKIYRGKNETTRKL